MAKCLEAFDSKYESQGTYDHKKKKIAHVSEGESKIEQKIGAGPIPKHVSSNPFSFFNTYKFNRPSNAERVIESKDIIKIVCISDTHNGHEIPQFDEQIRQLTGDILIHAGDFGERGTQAERNSIFQWLCSLDNFNYKIFIAGNMDGIGLDIPKPNNSERMPHRLSDNSKNVIYLENDSCKVLGLKIYGSPYTPEFVGGFQYSRQSSKAKKLWKKIPKDCDILISHGPPSGILDRNSRGRLCQAL